MAVYGLLNNNSNNNNNRFAEPRNLPAARAELAALQRAQRNGGAGPGANRNRNRLNFLQQWIAARGVARAFAQMHPLPVAPLPNAVRFVGGEFRGGPRLAPAPVAPLPAWLLNAAAPRAGPRLAPAPAVGFGLPAPRRNNAAAARAAQQRNNAALAQQLANQNAHNAAAIQQALNENVAAGIENAFVAGANNGINIPQNVQHAVAAAVVQEAAPAALAAANQNRNGNNEIRRARQRGADIAERLVKAKRVLILCAKYIKEGSIRKAKAFGEQAIKILNEVLKMVPPRRVIMQYIERLRQYAQRLVEAPRGNPVEGRRVLVALGAANSAGAAVRANRNNNSNFRAALNRLGVMGRLPAADPALFNQPGMSANLTRNCIAGLDETIPEFLFIKKILQHTGPGWNGRPRPLVAQIPAMLRCLAHWRELDAAVSQRFPSKNFLTPEEWEQWRRFGVGGWGAGPPPDKVWSHDFPTPRQLGSTFVGSPMHYEDLIKILTEAGLRGERLVDACMGAIHHFGEKNRDTIHGCAVAFSEIYRNAARNAARPGGSRNIAVPDPESVAKTCVDIINRDVSGGCFDKLVRELGEGIEHCQNRFPQLVEGLGRAPPGGGPVAARANNSWKGLNYNINVTNRGNLTNNSRMILHAVLNNHVNGKNLMTANQLWNLVKNKRIKIKREGQNSATVTLSAIQGARRWINNYHRNGYRKSN